MDELGGGGIDVRSKEKLGFCVVLFHCGDRGATVIHSNGAVVQKPLPFIMHRVESCKLPEIL